MASVKMPSIGFKTSKRTGDLMYFDAREQISHVRDRRQHFGERSNEKAAER